MLNKIKELPIQRQIEELVLFLEDANKKYYDGTSTLSDSEFDEIENYLFSIDPDNKYFDEVREEVSDAFQEVEHGKYFMDGLGKLQNETDFNEWIKDKEYIVEPKIDGVSVKLIFEKGKFNQAITRGKGFKGFDITRNVDKINFKKTIDIHNTVIFRGEIYLSYNDMPDLIKAYDGELSKSPRNIAAGIIKRLDSKYNEYLSVIIYDVMNAEELGSANAIEIKQLIKSQCNGSAIHYTLVKSKEVMNIYKGFLNERDNLQFDIDGVVLRSNDLKEKIAFKFPSISKSTILKDVVWQVKNYRVTPVAIIEPVEICGAIIERASLFTPEYVKNLRIGDKVEVSRRNDVIPYIEQVLETIGGDPVTVPTICPSCDAPLERGGYDGRGESLVCNNYNCSEKIIFGIINWFNIFDIKHISEATIRKLFDEEIFLSYFEFLLLGSGIKDKEILLMDGFGEKTLNVLKEAINKIKSPTLLQFFNCLNIPNTGESRFRMLINVSEKSNPLEVIDFILKEDLTKLDGISNVMNLFLKEHFKLRSGLVNVLLSQMKIKDDIKSSNKLNGAEICITGTLSKGRKYFEQLISDNGGIVKSSVSKGLTYLICGADAGSKLDKANKLGVKVITESEFDKLIGG